MLSAAAMSEWTDRQPLTSRISPNNTPVLSVFFISLLFCYFVKTGNNSKSVNQGELEDRQPGGGENNNKNSIFMSFPQRVY